MNFRSIDHGEATQATGVPASPCFPGHRGFECFRGIVVGFLLGVLSLDALAQTWTPLPAGPDSIGSFRWRKATNPDDPDHPNAEYIDVEWIPPPGGAPCLTTAIVQTYRAWFEDKDGNVEILDHPSDLFNGMDWTQFGPEGKAWAEDQQRRQRQSADPNTTPDGHTVDSAWCDQDPYYNGDDPRDVPEKGLGGRGTRTSDRPSAGSIFFTGTREKLVYEFEMCVYCFNDDGTLGRPLASMKWRWEKTKGDAGVVFGPTNPSNQPSKEHKDAADLFVSRHTRMDNGKVVKVCPDSIPGLLEDAMALNEELKGLEDEEAREAVRLRIKEIGDKIREHRGRQP